MQQALFYCRGFQFNAGFGTDNPDEEIFHPAERSGPKTFPAGHPKECIDYIWMYRGKKTEAFHVKERRVIEAPAASDHRPVKVTVSY